MTPFRVLVAGLFWCCSGYAAFAEAAPALSKDADQTPRAARLIFVRAEPIKQEFQVRDDRVEVVNLKIWFKNEGRSTARLLSVGASQVPTGKRLTPAEEENDFLSAREGSSIKLNGVVEPGQMISFVSQAGVEEQAWADFLARRKYLYSFVSVAYRSEGSGPNDDIETETCVWFQNGDLDAIDTCKTDRNRVIGSER
jgi:hypothetical protein